MAVFPANCTFFLDREVDGWIRYGLQVFLTAIIHPFQYARMLMMMGYEPIAATEGKTMLFGETVMRLPNMFKYILHIFGVDGFSGCYRGLAPRIVGSVLAMLVNDHVADRLKSSDVKDESKLTEAEAYRRFKSGLKLEVILSTIGIVISHPFHVVSLRMMAQFVGRETLYTSNLGSLIDIWMDEGIGGLFAGLLPRLLYGVGFLVLNAWLVFLLNKWFFPGPESQEFNVAFADYAVFKLLSPLQVVSTCLGVTGSRLKAAQPPNMPAYGSFLACWRDLLGRGQLFRGSNLFGRSQPIQSKD